MPNYQEIGSGLQGVAAIIAAIRKIRDPHRKEREELLNKLQTNPGLIQEYKIAGTDPSKALKPRFGDNKKQKELEGLINNTQANPETQRLMDIQKLYTKKATGSLLPEEEEQLKEFGSYGRVLTPEEREKNKLGLATTRQNNEESKIRLGLIRQEAEAKDKERKKVEAGRLIAMPAITRITQGKGKNLWEAGFVNGELSADERNAAYDVPEIRSRLDDERQVYIDQLGEKAGKQARRDAQLNAFVTDLMKDAMDAGVPLSVEQATQIANNPQLAEQNPAIKKAVDTIRVFNKKKKIPAAMAQFNREATAIKARLSRGEIDTEEAISLLNESSKINFDYTGFIPLMFGPKTVEVNKSKLIPGTTKTDTYEVTGGDPELKGMLPKGEFTVRQEDKSNGDGTVETQAQKATRWEALKKKYPNETAEQITARVNKGER